MIRWYDTCFELVELMGAGYGDWEELGVFGFEDPSYVGRG